MDVLTMWQNKGVNVESCSLLNMVKLGYLLIVTLFCFLILVLCIHFALYFSNQT